MGGVTTTVGGHARLRREVDGLTEISCSCGSWLAVALTGKASEIAWVERSLAEHHRRVLEERLGIRILGLCHDGCFDVDGHTDGCLYEGEET